jgi:hypothetical protein
LLDGGKLIASGSTANVVQNYITSGLVQRPEFTQPRSPEKAMNLRHVALRGADGEIRSEIRYDESLSFEFLYETNQPVSGTSLGIMVYTLDGTCAFTSADIDVHAELLALRDTGTYRSKVTIPAKWLNVGRYTVTVALANAMSGVVYDNIEALVFQIVDTGTPGSANGIKRPGILQPLLDWDTKILVD